jgi:hypothetical protein
MYIDEYVYHEAYLMVVACMYTVHVYIYILYIYICLAAGGLKHVKTGFVALFSNAVF